MKKTYEKPMVMFENFELSQNIAVCAWDVKDLLEPHNCGAIGDSEELGLPGIKIFTGEADSVCDLDSEIYEESMGDEFCYTVSSDNWTIFNS